MSSIPAYETIGLTASMLGKIGNERNIMAMASSVTPTPTSRGFSLTNNNITIFYTQPQSRLNLSCTIGSGNPRELTARDGICSRLWVELRAPGFLLNIFTPGLRCWKLLFIPHVFRWEVWAWTSLSQPELLVDKTNGANVLAALRLRVKRFNLT